MPEVFTLNESDVVDFADPEQQESPIENSEEEFESSLEETRAVIAKIAARAEQARLEQKKRDLDVFTEWLLNPSALENSDEMLPLFAKALQEKDESSDEEISQMTELLGKIPQIFQQFDQEIEKLKDLDGYSADKLQEKNLEIKKSLLDGIINGHLRASEVAGLIKGIEIVATSPDGVDFGYSAPFFVNVREGKIFVTAEALKDVYVDPKTKEETIFEPEDIRHMINHEISHTVTERGLVRNSILVEKSKDIIGKAESTRGTQSVHIENVLQQNIPEEIKIKEIITEYTAMYLKSDGLLDFVAKCLQMTDLKLAQEKLGITAEEIDQLSEIADGSNEKNDEVIAAMIDKSPAFYELWNTYGTFHSELARYFRGQNAAPNQEITDDDMTDEMSEEELAEWERDATNFEPATAPSTPYAEPATKGPKNSPKEEGIMSSMLGLVKAMAKEVPQ